jgi:hypothetical protein
MIYLNLKTSTLRSPEYIGSEPTARATWLNLLCYCCEQENGGIIADCGTWKDRQWQQTCGVTLSEVKEGSALWKWSDDHLAVFFYPLDKQAEVQAKREAGRRGGQRSGKSRREASQEAQSEASGEAELQAELQGVLERKGKERNGMERERKVKARVAEVSATSDKDWLEELASNPAYSSINIPVELGKMQAWCATNGRQASRRRFINWLNRAEKPIASNGTAPLQGRKPATAWELRQAIDAVKQQVSRIQGDPSNKTAIDTHTPWDRKLKPEAAEQLKQLKQREQELHTQLAMLGKEHTPLVRL